MTLIKIKQYINGRQGNVSKQMRAALIAQAITCYEQMEVAHPTSCGAGFVVGTINNARRR